MILNNAVINGAEWNKTKVNIYLMKNKYWCDMILNRLTRQIKTREKKCYFKSNKKNNDDLLRTNIDFGMFVIK